MKCSELHFTKFAEEQYLKAVIRTHGNDRAWTGGSIQYGG